MGCSSSVTVYDPDSTKPRTNRGHAPVLSAAQSVVPSPYASVDPKGRSTSAGSSDRVVCEDDVTSITSSVPSAFTGYSTVSGRSTNYSKYHYKGRFADDTLTDVPTIGESVADMQALEDLTSWSRNRSTGMETLSATSPVKEIRDPNVVALMVDMSSVSTTIIDERPHPLAPTIDQSTTAESEASDDHPPALGFLDDGPSSFGNFSDDIQSSCALSLGSDINFTLAPTPEGCADPTMNGGAACMCRRHEGSFGSEGSLGDTRSNRGLRHSRQSSSSSGRGHQEPSHPAHWRHGSGSKKKLSQSPMRGDHLASSSSSSSSKRRSSSAALKK